MMYIVMYKHCCCKSIKEVLHLTRELEKHGIEYDLHTTNKKGFKGQKDLTEAQRLDEKVYLNVGAGIEEFDMVMKRLFENG